MGDHNSAVILTSLKKTPTRLCRDGVGKKANDVLLQTYGLQLVGRQAFPTCRCQRTAPPHSSTAPRSQTRLHTCTCSMMPVSSDVAFSADAKFAKGEACETMTPAARKGTTAATDQSFII